MLKSSKSKNLIIFFALVLIVGAIIYYYFASSSKLSACDEEASVCEQTSFIIAGVGENISTRNSVWTNPSNIQTEGDGSYALSTLSNCLLVVTDEEVALVHNGSIISGNKADTVTTWSTASSFPDGNTATYGGSDDVWSAFLTPEIVNSATFGVNIIATDSGDNTTDRLRARDFGFNVPAEATVVGVEVEVNKALECVSTEHEVRVFWVKMNVHYEEAITVPSAPTDLSATATSVSEIDLSWTAPEDNGGSEVRGYKVERKEAEGEFTTIFESTKTTNTTYNDSDLNSDTLYTYRVSAINVIGTSDPSEEASATTFGVNPQVLSSEATNVTYNQATLNGDVPSLGDIETTEVLFRWRAKDIGGEFSSTTEEAKTEAGTFNFTLTDLDPETTYEYKAVVKWQDGEAEEEAEGALVEFVTGDIPVSTPDPELRRSQSTSSSAQSRVTNLVHSGNLESAERLVEEFPQAFPDVNSAREVIVREVVREVHAELIKIFARMIEIIAEQIKELELSLENGN